jgi:hypothetical protein
MTTAKSRFGDPVLVVGGGDSFQNAVAVTPSDSTDLAQPALALYIGVTGDVNVYVGGGTTAVLFKSVPVGVLPVAATRVLATSTSASQIVALY